MPDPIQRRHDSIPPGERDRCIGAVRTAEFRTILANPTGSPARRWPESGWRLPAAQVDKRSMQTRRGAALLLALSLTACASRHSASLVAAEPTSARVPAAIAYQANLTGL